MAKRVKTVGFDRTITFEWLEQTAYLSLQGISSDEVNAQLETYLHPFIMGKEARRKTRTVLMALWVEPNQNIDSFRGLAQSLYKHGSKDEHLILHWGMSLAVYPFFGTVAATIGRLFRLQGDMTGVQVRRRLVEKLGERETVTRAVQRLLKSFEDWHVLNVNENGTVGMSKKTETRKTELVAFLVEAVLRTNQTRTGILKTLIDSPCLFPFRMSLPTASELTESGRLEVIQQGSNEIQVALSDKIVARTTSNP